MGFALARADHHRPVDGFITVDGARLHYFREALAPPSSCSMAMEV